MEPRWLTEDERAAWVRFIAVAELLPATLDAQLRRDSSLTHFDYFVLAMLSETDGRTLRMTDLAQRTNATLPRLSHVLKRLEERGLIERLACPEDGRATNAHLTEAGWEAIVAAAPGHVEAARHYVFDALSGEQVAQLRQICDALLTTLDPEGRLSNLGSSS